MTFGTQTSWTDEKRQLLRTLRDQGLSYAAIGRQLGVSVGAVSGQVSTMGLEKRDSPLSPTRSPEKIALIEKLLRDGLSCSETAARAHADRNFVLKMRGELRLPPRDKRPQRPKKHQKFVFGRALSRPPRGAFPSTESIAEFIATRGVTMCPAAAVAATTATISERDRAAVAAYQEAKNEAWAADIAPRQAKAAAGLRAAHAARSRV